MSTMHTDGVQRPAIWAALRRLGGGTIAVLARESGAGLRTVRTYLLALQAAGHVTSEAGIGPRRGVHFRLAEGAPAEAPRLTRDGQPATAGAGQERMWRTMKMLRTFTIADLRVHAEVTQAAAASYCHVLKRAGYIGVQKPGKGGRGARQATFRFVRNTGPQPPQERRDGAVWDPNLGRVTWAPAATAEAAADAA